MNDLFDRALLKLNLKITEDQKKQFSLFFAEVKLFNPVYKLVKYEDDDELIIKHFMDSLAPYDVFDENFEKGDVVLDLGSGAGFPAIILAIIFPDVEFHLADRMKRRTDFLLNVVQRTGLKNVRIFNIEAEKLDKQYKYVTCRAFHPLFDIMASVDRILTEDGILFAYKAQSRYVEAEIALCRELPFSFELVPVKVPYLDEQRCLCLVKRK